MFLYFVDVSFIGYPHDFLCTLVFRDFWGIYLRISTKDRKYMSNTFNKKTRFRGFTLIELLVVIAIIGLLSTIIAAPIQNARKKARDAKKIAELKSVQLALEQYAESNSSNYPLALTSLSPQFMPLLPTFAASSTSNPRDAFGYVVYEAQATGGASTTFSYHLGAKLEVYGPALETDRDCIFGDLAPALNTPWCAVYNGNSMFSTFLDNGTQLRNGSNASSAPVLSNPGPTVETGGSDFETKPNPNPPSGLSPYIEESSSTCVTTNDCVFDVTSQQ
jgi:prepilin-type N-terminal cleavage/methylation domain-containing protein